MSEPTNINKDKYLVQTLEDLLEQAKKGEVISLAYIFSRPKNITGNGWSGMQKNNMAMIGELRILERDLVDCLVETRIDIETGEYSE